MRELPLIRRFRNRRRSKGQSLVEFALILPVFILFFAATLDLGRIAAAQVTVTNAAREGAFQAAKTPTDFDNTTGCPSGAASNKVVCRTILEASDSVITVAPSDINLSCDPSCGRALGNTVTVRVTGHFQLMTPLLAAFFGGSQNITFSAASTHQVETLPPPPSAAVAITAPPSATPAPSSTTTPAPTVDICTRPSAGFTHTTTPANKKAPVTLSVVDTSTSPNCGITSWFWQWGDGATSTLQNPGTHVYVAAGNYDVTLTVTNAAGLDTTGAVRITVR
jgi:Flp pilus assembly protein TadG